jgi:hypothetical protein
VVALLEPIIDLSFEAGISLTCPTHDNTACRSAALASVKCPLQGSQPPTSSSQVYMQGHRLISCNKVAVV